MKKVFTICLLALSLMLSGCGDRLLERSYSSVAPHSAAYWENEDADTLRAENYQELVNALLILLGEHNEDGVVRIYGEHPNTSAMAGAACVEVQQETALGAYLLDYMTYSGAAESGYYELTVHFSYRRTAEEQDAVVNATSTEALPDLLRAAIEEGRSALAVRVGYFGTDRTGVMQLVSAVHDEYFPPEEEPAEEVGAPAEPAGETPAPADAPEGLHALPEETSPVPVDGGEQPPDADTSDPPPEEPQEPVYDVSPWQVLFYPDAGRPEIVEVILEEGAVAK